MSIPVEILFTTSDKPVARAIRRVTGDCCSHVAIRIGSFVYHSDIRGLSMDPIQEFNKHNRIIHKVSIPYNREKLQSLYSKLKTRTYYDMGALLFIGLVLLGRALGIRSLPKQNLWESTGMYLCTELVSEYLYGKADSMITPHQLFVRISSKYQIT